MTCSGRVGGIRVWGRRWGIFRASLTQVLPRFATAVKREPSSLLADCRLTKIVTSVRIVANMARICGRGSLEKGVQHFDE